MQWSADTGKQLSLTRGFCACSCRCAAVELQCSMWQSTVKFPSDWFALSVNAWGGWGRREEGVMEKDNGVIFVISRFPKSILLSYFPPEFH